jgi:homoaconitase/3-isopropylmalate dehydratase large subunit
MSEVIGSREIFFGGPEIRKTEGLTVAIGGVIRLMKDDFLLNDVSTDQIIRVAHLLTDDMYSLGQRALCGLDPEYGIGEGDLKRSGKRVLVAGQNFGRGSSREQAVWALKEAGIGAVLAPSFGPIFRKNAAMLGLLTAEDVGLAEIIEKGESVPLEKFLESKDGMTRQIILSGGLFEYLKEIKAGRLARPKLRSKGGARKMNIYEQRIARVLGVNGVEEGDMALLPVDEVYSYVGLSGLARQALLESYGMVKRKLPAEDIRLYEDHFAHSTWTEIKELTSNQREWARELNIPESNYFRGKKSEGGGAGICHRERLENLDPRQSQVVLATDSHTPTIGALPILALPVGSTLLAAGIAEQEIPYDIGKVMRVELSGKLPWGLSIRDAQLELAAGTVSESPVAVVEYGGVGLDNLSLDQVVALCNMVPEVFGAEVAVTESFTAGVKYLKERWGIDEEEGERMYGLAQPGCKYERVIKYDLGKVTPWVARPGSPNNAVPLSSLNVHPKINKAYLVSCTLGLQDLKEAAAVVSGMKVAEGTRLIIVPSSDRVRQKAENLGLWNVFEEAGAEVVYESACGPCIGAGLGALEKGEVAITASNRNFPGRMGHISAEVYMGGAILTALGAILGHVPRADEFLNQMPRIEKNLKQDE